MKKSLAAIFMVFSMLLAAFGFVACDSEESSVKVTLSESSLTLTVGESHTLTATVTGSEDEAVFASSNEAVVTVSENGVVTAIKAGSATITASVSDVSATCSVTVNEGNSDLVPVIMLNYQSIELIPGRTVTAEASMTYDAAPVEGTFSWREDSNGAVISLVADGAQATVTAVGVGDAVITVSSSYNGKPAEKTMNVHVKNNISVEIENLDLVDGQYKLTLSNNPQGVDEIKEFTPSIVVRSGSDVVTGAQCTLSVKSGSAVKVENDKIIAQAKGQAVVEIVYESDGEPYTQEIIVTVTVPTKYAESSIDLQTSSASQELTINGIGTVSSVKLGSDSIAFTQSGETLTLSGYDTLAYGEHALTVEADNMTFLAQAYIVTRSISSAEDWNEVAATIENNTLSGYYVLANDINYAGKSMPAFTTPNWGGTEGFSGTFDGRGHVVKNLNITQDGQGFFGLLATTAVVRNVGFVDVTISAGATRSGTIGSFNYGTIENVFVVYTRVENYSGGLVTMMFPGATIRNCVAISTATTSRDYAIVFSTFKAATIENCYSVGALALYCDGDDTFDQIAPETDTLKNFADYAAAKAAELDLSAWNSDIWDVKNGFPVFKSYHDNVNTANAIRNNTEAPVSGSFEIVGTNEFVYTLKNEISGITLSDRTVTIVGNYGATFTVVATHGVYSDIVIEKTFTVASLPTTDGGSVDVDLHTGKVKLTVTGTASTAFVNGAAATFTQEGNTVTVTGITGQAGTTVAITVTTDTALYTYSAFLATRVIMTTDDWAEIIASSGAGVKIGEGAYYVLGADLDYTGKASPTIAGGCQWGSVGGFAGTFDGRGYTIKGLSYGDTDLSFFGTICIGAAVRNLAITESALVPGAYKTGLFACLVYGTVENIYMNVTNDGSWWTGALAYFVAEEATISHCYIELTAESKASNAPDAYFAAIGLAVFGDGSNVTDCYSIGNEVMMYINGDVHADYTETDNVRHFASAEDMTDVDLSSWDKSIWDTTGGKLRFLGHN